MYPPTPIFVCKDDTVRVPYQGYHLEAYVLCEQSSDWLQAWWFKIKHNFIVGGKEDKSTVKLKNIRTLLLYWASSTLCNCNFT